VKGPSRITACGGVVVFEMGTAGESVQVIRDEAVTVGSEQIAASVTVTFAIS
jgi:hypothetical protein